MERANTSKPPTYGAYTRKDRPWRLVPPNYMQQRGFFPEWDGCFASTGPRGACSGRGTCIAGVCDCHPGATGIDCAAPAAAGSASASAAPSRGLRIYVYDLPIDFGLASFAYRTWFNWLSRAIAVYSTEWRFLEYLLRDEAVRTHDPEEADLYLVPTLGSLGGMPKAVAPRRCLEGARLESVVRFLRLRHPYWDRSGGRDHVAFLTGDKGACELGEISKAMIFVTAWGLLGPDAALTPPRRAWYTQSAALRKRRAADYERSIRRGDWCYQPHKDVVIPPYGDAQIDASRRSGSRGQGRQQQGGWTRQQQGGGALPAHPPTEDSHRYQLLHVGGVWGPSNRGHREVTSYSQGMRQALYLQHGDDNGGRARGFRIINHSVPEAELRRLVEATRFCFAPSGHGWGMRMGKSVWYGCVPLVAQPFVVQPFETELPFADFSVRASLEDIPRLPQLLENISDSKLDGMRRAAVRARRAFSWRIETGGMAYNLTMLALCHRAVELRGKLKADVHRSRGHRASSTSCERLAMGVPGARAHRRIPHWYPPGLSEATRTLIAERSRWVQSPD